MVHFMTEITRNIILHLPPLLPSTNKQCLVRLAGRNSFYVAHYDKYIHRWLLADKRPLESLSVEEVTQWVYIDDIFPMRH